jgi:hypothetical protein
VQVAYKPDESTCLGLYIPLEAAENREEVEQYQERHLKRQADMAASAGQKVPGQVGEAGRLLLLNGALLLASVVNAPACLHARCPLPASQPASQVLPHFCSFLPAAA